MRIGRESSSKFTITIRDLWISTQPFWLRWFHFVGSSCRGSSVSVVIAWCAFRFRLSVVATWVVIDRTCGFGNMFTMVQLSGSRSVSGCGFQSSSDRLRCCCSCDMPSRFVPVRSQVVTSSQLKSSRGAIILASTQLPQSPRPLWPIRIPRPLIYSTNLADVDPVQLSELWEKTLKVTRDPSKIMKALRHSFMFVIVLAEQENGDLGLRSTPKVVGIGRAVSDGAFIATICDVAVDPEYQKQGIGRRIVKRLVQEIKKKGGPSGFAVFPPPIARRFFWLIGFRSDRKYRLMGYRGKEERTAETADADDGAQVLGTEEVREIEEVKETEEKKKPEES